MVRVMRGRMVGEVGCSSNGLKSVLDNCFDSNRNGEEQANASSTVFR